jgi:hypothetical protein
MPLVTGAESSQSPHKVGVGEPLLRTDPKMAEMVETDGMVRMVKHDGRLCGGKVGVGVQPQNTRSRWRMACNRIRKATFGLDRHRRGGKAGDHRGGEQSKAG